MPVTRGAGGQAAAGLAWEATRSAWQGLLQPCRGRRDLAARGVLGGLIIRKPGAALAVELLAALVSAAVGNQWGITTLYSGLAQGIGAELVFLALAYRRWGLVPAALAGAGAAVGEWILEFVMGNIAKSAAFNLIYLVTMIISGAVLAGGIGWALAKALAASGALSRFASGREARTDI